MTSSIYAEHPHPINLVELLVLGWPFTALTSFKCYINKILAKKLNIFVIVYLDNILIYTKDPS